MIKSLSANNIKLASTLHPQLFHIAKLSTLNVRQSSNKDVIKEFKHIPLNEIKVNPSNKPPFNLNRKIVSSNIGKSSKYTWITLSLLTILGGGSFFYFKKVKEELKFIKEADQNRATVGGPFQLLDTRGKIFTEQDLLNHFSLLYFGFSHCPDICPAELDKITYWTKQIKKSLNVNLQPIFITCDPARDDVNTLKNYLKDFNDEIIGLTGTHKEIKEMCKKYRVFFSTPETANPKNDYIVDHSAFTYLMDPEGNFVQTFGGIYTEDEVLKMIENYIKTYVPKIEREKRLNKWYSFLFK